MVSHYKAKGIIDPCNEIEVRPDGFARVFLLLKINKMECKNDWYLISATREYVPEIGMTFLVCIYSNGMTEKQIEYKHGDDLPTILFYERLD